MWELSRAISTQTFFTDPTNEPAMKPGKDLPVLEKGEHTKEETNGNVDIPLIISHNPRLRAKGQEWTAISKSTQGNQYSLFNNSHCVYCWTETSDLQMNTNSTMSQMAYNLTDKIPEARILFTCKRLTSYVQVGGG